MWYTKWYLSDFDKIPYNRKPFSQIHLLERTKLVAERLSNVFGTVMCGSSCWKLLQLAQINQHVGIPS